MQEKYHISRAFTTVVVAHQECLKSSFHTHEKRLNEFMMKSKLKQRSFAVGGEGWGSKSMRGGLRTLGQCKFLKNQLTTVLLI